MCSNGGPGNDAAAEASEFAARFAAAIDWCAAAGASHDDGADARLAATWALLAGFDPDLAARMARYDDQHDRRTG